MRRYIIFGIIGGFLGGVATAAFNLNLLFVGCVVAGLTGWVVSKRWNRQT